MTEAAFRTLDDRPFVVTALRNIAFDLRDYATGDGTTDDTAAFEAACVAAAGATLVVPEGTYLLDGASITVPLTIIGNQGAVFRGKAGGSGSVISATGITGLVIDGVKIDGNHANRTGGAALYFDACVDLMLHRVSVVNGYGFLDSTLGGAVTLNNCTDAEVAHCSVCDSKYTGLAIHGATGGYNKVLGGKYDRNGYSGIQTLQSPNALLQGAMARACGTSCITLNAPNNSAISCFGLGSIGHHGINVGHDETAANASGCQVIGGQYNGNAGFGVMYFGGATQNQRRIVVNGVEASGNAVGGVKLLGAYDCTIEGSMVESNGIGIQVSGNYNLVSACQVRASGTYGVWISSGIGNRMTGVLTKANTGQDIYDQGTGTVIDRNLGYNNALVTTSGTTEQTLKSTTIPGGMLGSQSGIRISAAGNKSGTAGNKAVKVFFGTQTVASLVINDVLAWKIDVEVVNATTTSQRYVSVIYNGTTIASTTVTGSTVDTSADVVLALKCQAFSAGDSITSRTWLVDLTGSPIR